MSAYGSAYNNTPWSLVLDAHGASGEAFARGTEEEVGLFVSVEEVAMIRQFQFEVPFFSFNRSPTSSPGKFWRGVRSESTISDAENRGRTKLLTSLPRFLSCMLQRNWAQVDTSSLVCREKGFVRIERSMSFTITTGKAESELRMTSLNIAYISMVQRYRKD